LLLSFTGFHQFKPFSLSFTVSHFLSLVNQLWQDMKFTFSVRLSSCKATPAIHVGLDIIGLCTSPQRLFQVAAACFALEPTSLSEKFESVLSMSENHFNMDATADKCAVSQALSIRVISKHNN
jgi:hypothetical protein